MCCVTCVEVRSGLMLLFNIVKSFVPMGDQAWDPFGALNSVNTSLSLCIIFLFLSFYSIKLSLKPPPQPLILLRFHNFRPLVFFSLFLSLLLPQRACWLYFLLLWILSYPCVSDLIDGFIRILQTVLSRTAGYNITEHFHQQEADLEMGGAMSDGYS